MHLEFERELTNKRFAEIGRPYRLFRDEKGRFIAICSAFELICWPGRIAHEGQKLRNRISVYSADTYERVAVLDLHYPVNDIAFHPNRAEMAIGSGSYDGGFHFEGELLVWNWEAGIKRSLLGEYREVVRCRYSGENQITLLLRPHNEEEYEGIDPFDSYIGVVISDLREPREIFSESNVGDPRLADLQPSDPSEWGFAPPIRPSDSHLSPAELTELKSRGFEQRHFVGDVAWLNDQTCVVVHQECHAEVWGLNEARQAHFTGEGYGVEIIPQHGEGFLIHVFQRGDLRTLRPHRSSLFCLHGGDFALVRVFENGCTFSNDCNGNLLARDVGDYMRQQRPRVDRVVDPSGTILFEGDLGSFDGLNHSLRLNGGRDLYFLRGSPPASHRHKVLCSVGNSGAVREIFPWDEGETHMMSPVAIFTGDDSVIRACEIYNPKRPGRTSVIESLSIQNGRILWSAPFAGCVVSLAAGLGRSWIAYSKTSGALGLIDRDSGAVLTQIELNLEGVPSIATALAVRGDRLLVGTIDGRLLVYRINE